MVLLVLFVWGNHTQRCSELTPGSKRKDHLGPHEEAGLNPGEPHAKQAHHFLYYHSFPFNSVLEIKFLKLKEIIKYHITKVL